jgi:8-oxo-dGTP diphosphatase
MTNPRPILAASTAVFRGRDVLLVKRGQKLGQGLWSLPGGKVEFGESAEAAARREVMEETGIAIEVKGLAGLYEIITGDIHYAIACYAALWESGEPQAASDAAKARFVAIAEISQLSLAPNTAKAIVAAGALLVI